MPYPTNQSLPPAVKADIKSPVRRRQFRHVWTSIMKEHPGNEARAFAGAWAATKRAGGVLKAKGMK